MIRARVSFFCYIYDSQEDIVIPDSSIIYYFILLINIFSDLMVKFIK